MKHLARVLASTCLLALSPGAAHAAPVTLQYGVVIDQICYLDVFNCPAGPFTGFTLTLTYADAMTEDRSNPPAGYHEARFGPPTMTMTGGSIGALANPFGTVTDDLSQLYMRQTSFQKSEPAGPS